MKTHKYYDPQIFKDGNHNVYNRAVIRDIKIEAYNEYRKHKKKGNSKNNWKS